MNALIKPNEFWRDRLELPNYEVGEAARYASVHSNTVTRWHQNTTLGKREPRAKLSYLQLIELALVAACKDAGMKLSDIRAARAWYAGAFQTRHPFATLRLKTDGIDLAMDAGAGQLLIGNKKGQLAWNSVIGEKFKEFEYDDQGLATRWHVAGNQSPVLIDPRVRFGAPHVAGVPTWLLKERWEHGEPENELLEDLNLKRGDLFAALSFEGIDPAKPRKNEWPS